MTSPTNEGPPEDVLPITFGGLTLETCDDTRTLLNKSDLRGKKRTSDAAYALTTHLTASQTNFTTGPTVCGDIVADIAVTSAVPPRSQKTSARTHIPSSARKRHLALGTSHTHGCAPRRWTVS